MDNKIFKAYKEKVIKLSTRDTAVRCTKTSLKKKVFDISKLNEDCITNITQVIKKLNEVDSQSIVIDTDCISTSKLDKEIENLYKKLDEINNKYEYLPEQCVDDLDFDIDDLEFDIDDSQNVKEISKEDLEEIEKIKKKINDTNDKIVKSKTNAIKQLNGINKDSISTYKQTGTHTLYLGYKFVTGKVDKYIINAPLILIPITISEKRSTKYKVVIEVNNNRQPLLNTKALIMLESLCAIRTNHEVSLENIIDLNIKQDIFKNNNLVEDISSNTIRDIDDAVSDNYKFTIYNSMAIGLFNVSTSIYNDYSKLETMNTTELIDKLLTGQLSTREQMDYKNSTSNIQYKMRELNLISSLDSSQECAVYMSDKAKGLVIFGPPGTGKSQVITNIVANSVVKGQKILLVSEKKTALDVVHNRLGLLNKYCMLLSDSGDMVGFKAKIINTFETYMSEHKCKVDSMIKHADKIDADLDRLQEIYKLLSDNDNATGMSISELYKKAVNNEQIDNIIINLSERDINLILGLTYKELCNTLDMITTEMLDLYEISNNNNVRNFTDKSILEQKKFIQKATRYNELKNEINGRSLTDLKYNLDELDKLLNSCIKAINLSNQIGLENLQKDNQEYNLKSINRNILSDVLTYLEEYNKLIQLKNIGIRFHTTEELSNGIDEVIEEVCEKQIERIKSLENNLNMLNKYCDTDNKDVKDIYLKSDILSVCKQYEKVLKAIIETKERFSLNEHIKIEYYEETIIQDIKQKYQHKIEQIERVLKSGFDLSKIIIEKELTDNEYNNIIANAHNMVFKQKKMFKKFDKENNENYLLLKSAIIYLKNSMKNEINNVNTDIYNIKMMIADCSVISEAESIKDIRKTGEALALEINNKINELRLEINNTKENLRNKFKEEIKLIDSYETLKQNYESKICNILKCELTEIVGLFNFIEKELSNQKSHLMKEVDELSKILRELDTFDNEIIYNELSTSQLNMIMLNGDTLKKLNKLDVIEKYILNMCKVYKKSMIKQIYINLFINIKDSSYDFNDLINYSELVRDIASSEQKLVKDTAVNIDYTLNKMLVEKAYRSNSTITGLYNDVNARKKNTKSIKELVKNYDEIIYDLYPVWMLTPETVSDILPLTKEKFDLVIFDEASQMFLEKAIPSLYRSKRVIVAGDDKQLRPSRFFELSYTTEESDEILEETTGQNTSLLDQAKLSFNSVNLMFHYRSRFAELIQFSNYAFYNNLLKLAPSVIRNTNETPISYINVSGQRKGGVNETEAIEVVNIVKKELLTGNRTIGIITLNASQKELIEDKLEELAEQDSKFSTLLQNEKSRVENDEDVSLFVKSIEDVQGDERDVIIMSFDRGYDENNKLHTSLGPIQVADGENRLNVAISRAKEKMYLVTSLEPEQYSVENSKNIGPKLFKEYLRFARAISNKHKEEANAIIYSKEKSIKETKFDSPFEEQVYTELVKLGWDVETQVGVRGYRIDLAVYDSELGRYIAGIECDGATYHSSKNAKERDVSRQKFLESRGWKILRVWSRDWWKSQNQVISNINNKLLELKQEMLIEQQNREKELDSLESQIVAEENIDDMF